MTTGSDIRDLRSPVSTSCGTAQIGLYWYRTWSGGNNPSQGQYPSIPPVNPQNGVYHRRKPLKRAKVIAQGEHNYTMSLVSLLNPVCRWYYLANPTNFLTGAVGSCWSAPTVNTPWSSNDDIALLGKLRQEIIGSDFNPAITLGEGRKSLETIARGANAIAGAILHAKRGNIKAAAKSLAGYQNTGGRTGLNSAADAAAGSYLNVKYGIKPILKDVYDAATSLAHLTSAPVRNVITATHRVNGSVKGDTVVTYSGYAFTAAKYKCILTEVDVIKMIGLTDPARVVWELMPYSFVADWFLPIGQYLEARGVANSVKGIFVHTKVTKSYSSGVSATAGSGITIFEGFTSYRRRTVQVDRTVTSSLGVPFPSIKPLKDWATWNNAASAVALVTQRKAKGLVTDE